MKKYALTSLAILFSSSTCAQGEPAIEPLAGYWQIEASMDGMMGGGQKQSKTMCLTREQLALEFEKVFMEAIPPKPPRNKAESKPTCQYTNPERLNGESTWTATCASPFGKMTAQGKGSYGENKFLGQQISQMNSPMGKMQITRNIFAKRLGECPSNP